MKRFFNKYWWWIGLAIVFLTVRVFVFITFWQASADKGGWQNFFRNAQAAFGVLAVRFHEICDWHPPLYYTFTSIILFLFRNQFFIYLFQVGLAFLALIVSYKLICLFFDERIAKISVFLLAIEPYWAWHNILLVSENLSTLLLLSGLYYLFKFLKSASLRDIAYSAIFLGLATLTRPNYLFLPFALTVLLAAIFVFKKPLRLAEIFRLNWWKYLRYFIIFNLLFFAVIAPWVIRNKIVYERWTLANIMSTNIYFYNLPPFLSLEKNISYADGLQEVMREADAKLGANVGDQGNCNLFDRQTLNQQFDFYESESKRIIMTDPVLYAKMHLFRAVPFFFQPGYFEMWSVYSGEFNKPDISTLVLKHDWAGIKAFVKNVNLKFVVYGLGVVFWGLASLALLVACVYSWRRDKYKFLFFLVSLGIILYNALLISPFVLARYRLPIYILFFVPLVYVLAELKRKYISGRE